MRLFATILALALTTIAAAQQNTPAPPTGNNAPPSLGFDLNDYPGDAALPTLRQHFAFTGYWLNNPPGERQNTWIGKRRVIRRALYRARSLQEDLNDCPDRQSGVR